MGQIGHMHRDCLSRVASGANKIPITTLSASVPKGAISASGSGTRRDRLYALATR